MKISVVSGGFDPIHSGHINYLKSASQIGDRLIVCLNSDEWLVRKKTKPFMPFSERKAILESIKYVDEVISFQDDENGSCIQALESIKMRYPKEKIIFCNGGDRDQANIPEMSVEGVSFEFSVGDKKKLNSSSWILKEWQFNQEKRIWGRFYNLFFDNSVKVKELIIDPGKGISLQRHFYRNEIWLVSFGKCKVIFSNNSPDNLEARTLKKFDHFIVPKEQWHQLLNPYKIECRIIEIQFGEKNIEEDIERFQT